MNTRSIKILLALGILALQSGCATILAASLHGKLPIESADSLKVAVNIAAVGGGTIEAKGVVTDTTTGQVKAAEYHEVVTTGGGSLNIDGTNVVLKKP